MIQTAFKQNAYDGSHQSKVMTAEKAVQKIPNGATITIGGLISVLCPEKVLVELEKRYMATEEPQDLTVMTPVRVGWSKNESTGLEHVANSGMLKRLISGSFNVKESPKLTQMISDNEIEAYGFSMGTIFHWIRAMAAGESGLVTKVGLYTYVDPRYDGGRLNAHTKENVVDCIEINGEEHLFYKSLLIKVAIIRGTTADESGNITLENEPVTLSGLEMAMAAKANGGYVIAQVKRVVANNTLHPRDVAIPSMLVDAVVVDPDQKQSLLNSEDPSWTGEVKIPTLQAYNPLPLNSKKVILRRAAKELQAGDVINLGVGIPVGLPQLAIEEGFFNDVTFSLEHGAVGGIPMSEEVFGAHINPSSIITSPQVFDFYHCGGLSATLLGFAQIDSTGNVNVSMFNGVFRGSGGFIDIVHKTKKIMFCGTFTSGGLEVNVKDGKLDIEKEGRHKKFIGEVEQLTFNAKMAIEKNQEVLYITERAVFRLVPNGLTLIEYAPGVDIQRDILAHIDFNVRVSPDAKEMDAELFAE